MLTGVVFRDIITLVVGELCNGSTTDSERCVRDAEVAGSNPVTSTLFFAPKSLIKSGFWEFSFFVILVLVHY